MLAIVGISAQGICRFKAASTPVIKRGKVENKAEKWAARGERLAAALRENLKRRKAQARGKATSRLAGTGGHKPDGNSTAAQPVTQGGPETPEPDFRRNRGPD
jgi:hypothetical protein